MTAVVFNVAAIANNNLQDLKTGQLVDATPSKQQWALLVGVLAGAAVIPPVLELVNKEKDMMQQSYARDYAELTRLREQYNQLSTENAQHCEELRLIHASRGFKLLNMGYPIKKRIWKIFGKEI